MAWWISRSLNVRPALAALATLLWFCAAQTPAQSTADDTPAAPAATVPAHRAKEPVSNAHATPGALAATAKPKPAAKKKTGTQHTTSQRSSRAARLARTARIRQAFVASKELQPMAQQLATLRTPAA